MLIINSGKYYVSIYQTTFLFTWHTFYSLLTYAYFINFVSAFPKRLSLKNKTKQNKTIIPVFRSKILISFRIIIIILLKKHVLYEPTFIYINRKARRNVIDLDILHIFCIHDGGVDFTKCNEFDSNDVGTSNSVL